MQELFILSFLPPLFQCTCINGTTNILDLNHFSGREYRLIYGSLEFGSCHWLVAIKLMRNSYMKEPRHFLSWFSVCYH